MSFKTGLLWFVVLVSLGLSGYWLWNTHHLELPKVDLPPIFGNEMPERGGERPEGLGERHPPTDRQGGGERGDGAEGLQWSALPDVLSNVWWIACTTALLALLGQGYHRFTALIHRPRLQTT